ncbi:bacteriocin-like protein [Chryseobacterium sp. 22458]
MKNVKKISRENLKAIKGGLKYCNDELPCGEGWCCAGRTCRPIDSSYCQF